MTTQAVRQTRGSRTRDRSTATWAAPRKALLTLHIVSAVGLLGSVSGLLVAGIRAATRADVSEAHAIYELMGVLPFALGIPLSFLALGSGTLLALMGGFGLIRRWWVTAKLALLVATILAGALVTGRGIGDLADATALTGSGDRSGEWALVAVLGVQLAFLVAASVLAVFKPGESRRRDSHRGVRDDPASAIASRR